MEQFNLNHNDDRKWLKYLFPMKTSTRNVFFSLTPWCFYAHGVKGALELSKSMYPNFTLLLVQGDRLIISPDYILHEIFYDGNLIEKNSRANNEASKFSTKSSTFSVVKIVLHEKDQILLIRDSFFGKKIDSVLNLPLIHNSIIRSLLSDLLNIDAHVELTETLHAIANMVFILTSKQQVGEVRDKPIEIIINAIIENYKDKNFNLDKLSSIVLMSRRKVQYMISEIGETFTSLVNKLRFEEMKKIINENPRIRLTELIDAIGVKNCYAANKIFIYFEGVNIKEYKEKLRMDS